ncbi:efflux RND transporter periplasmic adaptor subunit [Marinilabiliaceae bacterium JC017]|nr:efflux RND transporter periplasmic adaptor subunit [Marinilabiliaceae bacterium JC017]
MNLLYKSISTLLIGLFLVACNQSADNSGRGHAHDEVKLSLTAYSDNYEVFAETDPWVVGHNTDILAHFTGLIDFKPLENARVTVSLVVGTKGIRQTRVKAVRPGIYSFTLQPVVSGRGELRFEIEKEDEKDLVVVKDIQVYKDEHDAIHDADEAEPPSANAIQFTKEQSWKIDFATGYPAEGTFGAVIKAPASVAAAPSDEVVITARSSGLVRFISGSITEGQNVRAGEELLRIVGKGMVDNNAEVKWNQAKSDFELARADYERKQKLAEERIVSQKALMEAKSAYEKTRVEWSNLNQSLNRSGEPVLASLEGYVHQLYVNNGQFVEAGTPLVSIVRTHRIMLRAMVRQSHLTELKNVETAHIIAQSGERKYTLEELNGRILSYGRSVSRESYLLPVSIEVDYRPELVAGGFADVFLKSKPAGHVISVPESALVEEQGNFFVFVQVTPELFEKREVKTGSADGIETEIVSGLAPRERIVTRGAILVKLAAVSTTIDPHAGHVH